MDGYLKDIPNGESITKKSFDDNFIHDFKSKIDKMFPNKDKSYMEPEFIKCKGDCEDVIEEYIQKEISSTAYILRCLQMSMLGAPLDISYSGECSGKWEEDKSLFTINNFKQKSGRLIMGFGPSASGKTFWAKRAINMMKDLDATFPKDFLSIDGGTYREASVVYQTLVTTLINKNIGGLSNLVSAGFSLGSSMFSAGHIKNTITDYLKTQNPPNLYVSKYK